MEPFLGEIRLLPYTFAPVGWLDCDGRVLSIAENDALFALLGTTYGGDGVTTFGLPDLRGRLPVHQGQGPGLSPYTAGQMAGTETVTLTTAQLPPHTHAAAVTSASASTGTPGGAVQLGATTGETMYTNDISGLPAIQAASAMVGAAGGTQPHDNTMPTLAVRYCIAVEGIYPTQS
ncbi:MAG TPA: tail fiber protein [Xanthomonadaceae bacterium]|jgi:microcystin-dependent protein|nr:tail fiber protein [Xanthomonadaceae bacterium]